MASARKRPPALKHGLFSRSGHLDWSRLTLGLASALLGPPPHEPQVVEAAREAAEAILYARHVQRLRLQALENATLARANPTDAERALATELSARVKTATTAEVTALREKLRVVHDKQWIADLETAASISLHLQLRDGARELRRLADYERKALSLRRKAIRRVDYERIEAERRMKTL